MVVDNRNNKYNNILLALLLIGFMVFACNSETDKPSFSYVIFNDYNSDIGGDTILTKLQTTIEKNGTYSISYMINSDSLDTIQYILKLDNSFAPKYKKGKNFSEDFVFHKDTVVMVNNDKIKVMEYLLNTEIIDGGSVHYWSPQYGVFLIHSTTWPSIRILCSSDVDENLKILELVKAVCPHQNFFFRGKLLETMEKI
jgi:hypothetical protein